MHIKQIIISNFRSFREQPEITPFSPSTNTVVGRNGSGKSNLFDAVQFCLLGTRFANLRAEERQAILHEGSGSAAVSAFVEIVFDNSDHRFQLENSDEVVLRRVVGHKKDELFLQRKRASKGEIQSLLEGAGFSSKNPYYIIQQGKVQDLCMMSDKNRLQLLKEVAGTTLYDEKKAESLAKMEENNSSIAKISEILADIEQRLEELQSEKDELNAYQQADRSRRAAEYCLYDKELRKARSTLDAIEHERADHAEAISELHDNLKENHDAIRNVETVLKQKSNQTKRNRQQLNNLEQDNKKAVQNYTRLQLECKELEEEIKAGDEQERKNQQELAKLNKEIEAAEAKLQELVIPEYDVASQLLQQMEDERDSAARQVEALYAKQSRGRQFQTKAQRDKFLRGNIKESEAAKQEKVQELSNQQDKLANLRRTLEKNTARIATLQQEVTENANALQSMSKTVAEKKREREQVHETRKEEWRKAEECQELVRESRDSAQTARSDLRKVMPRATAMGLEALNSIVDKEGLRRGEQYFGMLMENMKLREEKFQTAVEVAAQNALFHVIVDTDHTAARLMKRLEDGKLGRVTFLPLNQLRVENVRYPDNTDIRPMLDLCVEYDPKVRRAMEHVFNRKLIARNEDLAAEWSTKLGMDAITLDGVLCGRKGAMTGGFVDTSKSRLGAHVRLKESQAALEVAQRDYQTLNRKAQEVDHTVQTLMKELQRIEKKEAELNHLVTKKENEIDKLEKAVAKAKKQIEEAEKSIPPLEKSIGVLETEIQRIKDEMGTELKENLSSEEKQQLTDLKKREKSLGKEIETQSERVTKAAENKQKLQSLLEDNLLKRRQELTEGSADNDEGDGHRRARGRISFASMQAQRREDLEERHQEMAAADKVKEDIEARLEEARSVEQALLEEFNAAKNELDKLKGISMKLSKQIEDSQSKSEQLLNKRSMCISKRETYVRKIQELGSLPPPTELQKFEKKSIPQLMKSLDDINKKLKKYSHVNKKAFDQYVNFSEQRESLLKRKGELDRGADKVKELIDSLDRQKDEAINRTFRGVSAHFKDVFKALVPNGAGELLMRTAVDDDGGETDEEDDASETAEESPTKKKRDPNNLDVSLYRGVGIKVRFTRVGENYMMSQLSGGQKALVALALIFAIQRCDPAPFYLFDELDQALDSSYRASVASLIQNQANDPENPTQFIVSTFRQELVSVANRCFGISHQNKVSSLHPLTKKDAQKFIANLMSEEEAVGDVTSLAASRSTKKSRDSRKRKAIQAEEPESEGTNEEATTP